MDLARDLTKIAGSLLIAGGLGWAFVPPAIGILARPGPTSAGPRPLIVISTQGGTSDQSLDLHMSGDINGDLNIQVNLRIVDKSQTQYQAVSIRVTVFGASSSGIQCQGVQLPPTEWNHLSEGARNAYRLDSLSESAGAHPLGGGDPEPSSRSTFGQWSGTISAIPDNTARLEKRAASLNCSVPSNLIWSNRGNSRTALLPQVNFNAIDNKTDFQSEIVATSAIDRDPEWTVTESYPEATIDGYSIRQELSQFWQGRKGEMGNIGYTSQPDILMAPRNSNDKDAKTLALAGIALGVAGNLITLAFARILDLTFRMVGKIRRLPPLNARIQIGEDPRLSPVTSADYHHTMKYNPGTWRTFGERTVYDNRWVRLGLVDVQAPNGERWDYHVVHFSPIAIAMIVDDEDRVLMLWRYRFATDQWGFELLGGLVEDGEEPAQTAAREAEEESGYRPVGEPEHLVGFEPLPGNVTAPVDVFLWRQAEKIGEPTDTEEVGRLEWVPLSGIPELAKRRELLGSGALVPLLYYAALRAGAAAGGQDEGGEPA